MGVWEQLQLRELEPKEKLHCRRPVIDVREWLPAGVEILNQFNS